MPAANKLAATGWTWIIRERLNGGDNSVMGPGREADKRRAQEAHDRAALLKRIRLRRKNMNVWVDEKSLANAIEDRKRMIVVDANIIGYLLI